MKQKNKVQLNMYITETIKNRLYVLAARQMLTNPGKLYTASGMAALCVTRYLDLLERETSEPKNPTKKAM